MDSDKIQNLETLAEIIVKLEFELNRVKDWIKTQISVAELNCWKNSFQNDNNYSQADPNLIPITNIYHESDQVFQGSSQNTAGPAAAAVAVVVSKSKLIQNPSTSTTNTTLESSQNLQTKMLDDIVVTNVTRDFAPDLIVNYSIGGTENAASSMQPAQNSFIETVEIDPLQLSVVSVVSVVSTEKDHNEEPVFIRTQTNGEKRRTRFNPDILERIKSEQILESAKNLDIQKNIPKGNIYICTVCNKKFPKLFNLKIHLEIHLTTRKYVCRFCSKRFKTYNSLHSHICQIHRGERNDHKLKCDSCGLGFARKSALDNHQIEAHIGLKCKFCDEVFDKRHKLSIHIQKIHLICATPGCKKQFLSQMALKQHRRKNHPSNRTNH